jgi:transposase
MGKRTRRRYSEEFKAEAVNLVEQHGYGVAEAARRLDIDRSVLARWLRDPQGKPAPARAEVDERDAELRRLREENRKLLMEKEILKKAAAFFAKESS